MSSPQRRPEPSGVLDTAYAVVTASTRTALTLTLEGPALVRGLVGLAGLATQGARATAELGPAIVESLRALPRLVALLEQLAPVADQVSHAVQDAETDPAARIDAVARAVVRLADAVDPLAALAGAVGDLHALAGATSALQQLGGAADDLATLAGAGPALGRLGGAVDDLHALAGTSGALHSLGGAAEALDTLARAADENLPELTQRLGSVDASLATTTPELQKVSPDLRTVAQSVDALDDQIQVLAEALSPLQGTAERVGNLVDKLPGGNHTSKAGE